MAEKPTTEDDDDEGFGDFTFAPAVHSNPKINGPNLSFNNNNDDDWGDFVNSNAAVSRPASLPVKSIDPFSFSPQNDNSAPTRSQNQVMKPRGALPLSIFGEEDKEEEEGSGSVAGSILFNGATELKVNKDANKKIYGSQSNVSDLISNLYKQNEPSKSVNGSKPDSNGLGLNFGNLSSHGLNLNSNGLDLKRNVSKDSNALDLKRSASDFYSNGLNLDADEHWEFKGAGSKLPVGNLNLQSGHQAKAINEPKSNLNGFNSSWNVVGSDLNGLSSNFNGVSVDANQLDAGLADGSEDFGDDDGWEFKDAQSEFKDVGSEAQSRDSNSKVDSKGLEGSEGVKQTFGFGNDVEVPTDIFAASHGTSQKSGDWNFGFDFSKSSAAPSGISSNSYSNTEQKNNNENGLNSTPVKGNADSGENLSEVKGAFSEIGSKDKMNKVGLENHKVALPLSLFGDGESETDDPLTYQDVSTNNVTSSTRDDTKKIHGSNISINDLISSLYNQADQHTSVNHIQSSSENDPGSTNKALDPNFVDDDDDFDDDSWEFKGSYSGKRAEDQTSVPGHGDSHINYSTKVEAKDYADFYSKLQDELCFIAQHHLDDLKKARNTADLWGRAADVKALDKEIQDLDNELHQDSIISKKVQLENRHPGNICLNEFVEALQEQKFHSLEAECHLSRRLSLAEKDWRSTIELLKHAASTSKILTLGSRDEQSHYVSTWFKMVTVCAQELRHGALIWKQALQKNVHSQMLSDSRGKQYILALGEIFRVVEVLGSSTKLYKPWMLSSSTNPTDMFTLLSECSTLWSSSGLEEALRSISGPLEFEYNGTPKELLESIKYIRDLDSFELHNHVFSSQEPTCQLSGLAAGTVPGMKMVVWNEEHYYLPLANLWANLVSSDPPNLPRMHIS